MAEILKSRSNAQYYGYRVGDKFRYKPGVNLNEISDIFASGDTLILELDDDSIAPRFRNQYGQNAYEYLELLEKIEDKPQEGEQKATPEVTFCPSAAIQEMLLACFSDDISVEISMDRVTVNWQGLSFVVDEEVSLEQIVKAVDLLSQQQVEV